MAKTPTALTLGVLLLAALLPATASEHRLTFDDIFADDASGLQPRDLRWSPGGTHLAYRWKDDGGDALWVLDLGPGAGTPPSPVAVLRPGEAGTAEDFEIDELGWMPDGGGLLLTSAGDLYLLRLGGGGLRRLTETEAEEEDPKPSPDGTRVAFVRDFDLHLMDLTSGEERALTEGGERNRTLNGITDWVYWEELWGRDSTGFWWSPDGRRIAYYQFDETPVATYPLVDFLPRYPEVEEQRYPKAGSANPRVRVGVLDLASGETTWLATGPDPTDYLARVDWLPAGDRLAIQRLNREQNRLDLLFCTPVDGACSTVLSEEHPTWVNLGDGLTFLADGRFLWSSERSGWRHLYLYGADGTVIRQLTSGSQAVTSLDSVDESTGRVVYTAYGPGRWGGAERRVYALSLDGGGARELSPEGGWSGARVAPESGLWVHTWSDGETPGTSVVRNAGGELVAELPSTPPEGYDPAELPRWKTIEIPGPDGVALPARLLEPEGLDPARRYPVIMYHYGCPASQVVADRWDGRGRDLWHKMMAQRGYGVLSVDNQASVFFGKAGEDRAHRRFGPGNLAAQLAGVEYLKGRSWVDPGRIGLWGWSGGGSNTLYSLLGSPGTWKAGVAGAPVTDWRLYDTIWTERYLDHPDDNPEGYEASSPVTYAAELADALLIVHGTADDNVHPQNTIVMSNALIEAGKPFEQAIYPRQKHGFRGKATRHFYERMTEFFDRHLGAPEPGSAPTPPPSPTPP